jgi:hypothetical protein
MNAFERHGITHLSASSINLFAAAPALWVMERLLNKRGPASIVAHRGAAAEHGIAYGLLHPDAPPEDCQARAVAEFDRLTALSSDPKREAERAAVSGIVTTGLAELRQYGIPDATQQRVDLTIPGVAVPIVGYADFVWQKHGVLVELKTQLKLASAITASHGRQAAIYAAATNYETRVAYVTPAKCGVYRLDNAAEHIQAVGAIASRMEALLSVSTDPAKIAGLVVPDYDSFYWSHPVTRAMGREVFGF